MILLLFSRQVVSASLLLHGLQVYSFKNSSWESVLYQQWRKQNSLTSKNSWSFWLEERARKYKIYGGLDGVSNVEKNKAGNRIEGMGGWTQFVTLHKNHTQEKGLLETTRDIWLDPGIRWYKGAIVDFVKNGNDIVMMFKNKIFFS